MTHLQHHFLDVFGWHQVCYIFCLYLPLLKKNMIVRAEDESTLQKRGIGPMLGWRWPIIYNAGPTTAQHWANALCLQGDDKIRRILTYNQ